MISVVGLGPAGREHLTAGALEVLDSADVLFLRTLRHPAAEWVAARRQGRGVRSFDDLYETAESFEAVYDAIVAALVAATATGEHVCYAVPGSPSVAEQTVELLRCEATDRGIELRVEPALSFADLAWDRLGIDPAHQGVRLTDPAGFAVAAAGGGPLLVAQTWSSGHLSEMKLALDPPGDGTTAVLLHHLGLPDERVEVVEWEELDRTLEPDHLTCVYVPAPTRPPGAEVTELLETIATLRRLCPWDREQTHLSLVRHLLEEAYEAIEAIEALGGDPASAGVEAVAHAEEELGDLLCQVVMHATIGEEEGLFSFGDVARSLSEKLTVRHPHVFSPTSAGTARTADDVVRNWERAKDVSKEREHLLDGIPVAMPALARAEKIERKLRSVGLGWEETPASVAELASRLDCLARDRRTTEEEAGAVLVMLARLLASRHLDAEAAVRRSLGRLGERVAELEAAAESRGSSLAELAGDEGEAPPVHKQHLQL